MSEKDNTLLTLNEIQYRLALVLQNARSGPEIVVNPGDLNDQSQKEHQVKMSQPVPSLDDGPVIFFKQNGKYTVLTGKNKVECLGIKTKAPIKGRLISSVSIKNAKVVLVLATTEHQPSSIDVRAKSSYGSEFANRPKFEDERKSRYASNAPARSPTAYRGSKNG
jgi:hypothetical protein